MLPQIACRHARSLQSCPTLQPHGQQPARLLCPRDSLGKNTGVGFHFLLHLPQITRDHIEPCKKCQMRDITAYGKVETLLYTQENYISQIPLQLDCYHTTKF